VHTLAAGLVFLLAVSSGICQPCRKHFQVGGQYRSCHKKFTKPEGPDFQATEAKFLSRAAFQDFCNTICQGPT
jgi:hypothetical protein